MMKCIGKDNLDVGAGPSACPDFTKGNHKLKGNRSGLPLQKDLPEGWNILTLNNVCEINPRLDKLKFPADMEVSFVPMAAVGASDGKIDVSQKRSFHEVKKGFTSFQSGDVLFAKITPCMENGKMAVVPKLTNECGFGSTEFHVLRPNYGTDARYIYYYVSCENFRREAAHNMTGAVGQKRVSASYLSEQQIPIAPADQQKLIVSEIEKQFSRLDEAVAALKRVRASLKRYKASVLKAAVEGKLMEEWRKENPDVEPADKLLKRILAERKKKWEEANPKKKYKEPSAPDTSTLPELPKGWVWATTDQLFSFVTSGSRGWASYYSDSGPLFLRMGNLDHDTIKLDLSDIQHVQPPEGTEGTRTRVMSGDILISITADVGMIGIVPDGFEEAYINQHVALGRPSSSLNNTYLAWSLTCKNGQDQLNKLQRGATKVGLGLEDIRDVSIPLPPLTEQKAIIEEVDRCFSVVEEIDTTIEMNLKRAESLRQAILKKAFSGRLV